MHLVDKRDFTTDIQNNKIMKQILFGIFLSNILYSCVHASALRKKTTESFIVHYLEEKRIVPVRIELNTEQQTEHVLSSRGGETLYDFSQGKVAYKDINSSQCFIANITEESLEGDRRRLRNLRNGVVRGSFLPTFIIREEFINDTQKFGNRLARFCEGNTVSLVERQQHRRKRDADEKGQLTHHSYGHYGHQSNNYAHYGHETYLTGSVDKDGQIRNPRISHQQVRSESSSGYPGRSYRDGPELSTDDSTVGISRPQMQTQYQMPTYQQASGSNGRNFGTGGSGQFSLQTAQESGYQLNLPLGLHAGNTYRGGISSSGQYGVGGLQPQITTEYQKYPGTVHSQIYRPGDQRRLDQTSPRIPSIPGIPASAIKTSITPDDYTKIRDRTSLPGYLDSDQTPQLPSTSLGRMPTVTRPISSTTSDRGRDTSGFQTDSRFFRPTGQAQPGADIDEVSKDQRLSGHRIPPRIEHSGLQTTYPGSRMPLPSFHPGVDMPSIHRPGISDPSSAGTSGGPGTGIQTGIGVPGTQTIGMQPVIRTSGRQVPGIQQQYIPSSITPQQQQFLQPSSITYPREYGINGDIVRTQDPVLRPPTIPGHPHSDRRDLTPTYSPASIDSTRPGTVRFDHDRNGIQQPGSLYQQPTERREYTGVGVPPAISGIPGDSTGTSVTGIRPGDAQFLPRGVGPTSPEQTRGYQTPSLRPGPDGTVLGIPGESRGTPITGMRPGDVQFLPRGTGPTSPEQRGYQIPYLRPGQDGTIPGIPVDSRGTPITGVRPGDAQFLPRGTGPTSPEQRGYQIPSLRTVPGGTIPGIPVDSRGTPITGIRPGDVQVLPRGTGPTSPEQRGYQIPSLRTVPGGTAPESAIRDSRITSRGTTPTLTAPGDRRIVTDQFGRGSTGLYGQDSAASQTQIQTGLEGTAAEASAAGQYRGLGSQTQVQGGYAGNGSFSAQAQSGFTGGVVQSQVQGGKLGGLSGSSAQVERVGSAQSQVQVLQPSGAASSSAQGRFLGGTTQVQAQSGKTGGSAGAQSQSTGLSSSHVQVNIGGNDVSEREKFQGTVSASVQGGHSSGQSQTQLQGGYESGRTYVATAQGGFDSSSGIQVSAPPVGSLTRLSNHTVGAVSNQSPLHTVGGRPVVGSPAIRLPPGYDLNGRQTDETLGLRSRYPTSDQTIRTQPTLHEPDQRPYSGRLPQQQYSSEVSPQRTLYPPRSQAESLQGSRVQYPSLPSDTQRYFPSPQITGYTYPGYPTDIAGPSTGTLDENQISGISGTPGFRRYDQSGILPPDLTQGSPHIHQSEIPGYPGGTLKPPTYLPGVIQGQDGSQYISKTRQEGTGDTSYPSSIIPSWRPTDQYNDTTGIPSIFPDLSRQQPGAFSQSPYSPTLESRYIPGYPSSLVPPIQRPDATLGETTGFRPSSLPGLKTGHYPIPSHYPGQSPIWPQSLQTTPSHIRPGEQSILTRPDAVPHFGLQPPSSSHIRPQQPSQFQPHPDEQSILSRPDSAPHFGLQPPSSSHIGPQQPGQIQPYPGGQSVLTRPDSTPHFGLQPPSSSHIGHQQPGQIQPQPEGQSILTGPDSTPHFGLQPPPSSHSLQQPQISPRVSTPGIHPPSKTTYITPTGQPGVSEPDTRNCCEALRDLKRRCCGRTSKKEEGSTCCKSASSDEIFDFSSEDDDDDSKRDEPCKIVKAICYIVYKPVGKARICKPTQTNGC